MEKFTLESEGRRVRNICASEEENKKYYTRHRIHRYMPGQVIYHLGDYPARFSFAPTEYDVKMLTELRDSGVELIQLHEDWNDSIRRYGADKFSCFDPDGLQKFVDLCHSLGLKVIPYISTGYLHEYDPDFRPEFIRGKYYVASNHFKYLRCNPASAYWREYLIPRTFAAIDKYGFDGVYNDMGYDDKQRVKDEAIARGETEYVVPYGPEIEDLLSTIYSGIKERGGVYKVHADSNNAPPCKDKVYDYLWIGENVSESKYGIGKEFYQYIVPCADYSMNPNEDYREQFIKTIPFMQFPLLTRGRPMFGKDFDVPGVTIYSTDDNVGTRGFRKRVKEYMAKNPNGPYVYSLWSKIPDDLDSFDLWSHYLSLYRPMVTENSLAYIEIRECGEILSPLEGDIYASMFVNEDRYIVLSNLTDKPYELSLRGLWENRETNERAKSFMIAPGTIIFLKEIFI